MSNIQRVVRGTLLLGLIAASSACVVTERQPYREGYYDRDHHRYYHEHTWHECGERANEYCRDR